MTNNQNNDTSYIADLLDKIPDGLIGGKGDKKQEMQNIQENANNSQLENVSVSPRDPEEVTQYGQNLYVVGNITTLGDWSTSSGVKMDANKYTSSNPQWETTVGFQPGVAFEYKYYRTNTDGSVTWETGGNRVYKVGNQCPGGSASTSDTWQN